MNDWTLLWWLQTTLCITELEKGRQTRILTFRDGKELLIEKENLTREERASDLVNAVKGEHLAFR